MPAARDHGQWVALSPQPQACTKFHHSVQHSQRQLNSSAYFTPRRARRRKTIRKVDACTPIAGLADSHHVLHFSGSSGPPQSRPTMLPDLVVWFSEEGLELGLPRNVYTSSFRRMGAVTSHNFADSWLLVTSRDRIRQATSSSPNKSSSPSLMSWWSWASPIGLTGSDRSVLHTSRLEQC